MKRTTAATRQRRAQELAEELARLYGADETAWLERMAELIEQRRYEELDFVNLSELLLSMALRDRREVFNRLTVLLTHRLKRDYQPRNRSRSWDITIRVQREDLADLLESQSLRNHATEVLAKAYARAVGRAAAEIALDEDRFPATCPYTLDELLSAE